MIQRHLLRTLSVVLLACVANHAIAQEAQETSRTDMVVYGGTSAGVIAALQADKMGKSVALVCPDTHLGGLSSGGLGWTDTGNKDVIGGLAREFYHRIYNHYQRPEAWRWQPREEYGNRGQGTSAVDAEQRTMWIFEPHVAEQVFEEMLQESNVKVYRDEWLDRESGVVKQGSNIASLRTLSGKTFEAKVFIDASYEGDLMAAAGATYHVGREANSVYGEKWNGVQVGVLHHSHFFKSKVDPYIVPGDPSSGLLPKISSEPPGEYGEGDHRVQAYCFRMCLSRHPDNRVPFPRPAGYDPADYELLLRVFATGRRDFFAKYDPIPNLKTDTNNHGPFSTDNIGFNYDYPEASYERRQEIIDEHRRYQQGLMYFVANDPRVPEDIRSKMSQWGLARDEFTDNGHWPHQLYIREARRLVGEYVMTEADCLLERDTPQSIGMGSYTMDSHNVQRYVTPEGYVQNEGDIGVKPPGPYSISFGSVLPKKGEVDNLLVPVCVSASHIAFGSIRMEPVFMVLGQSAATAGCMAMDDSVPVQEVNYDDLRARLLSDGQVLEFQKVASKQRKPASGAWRSLSCDHGFDSWRTNEHGWSVGGDAEMDPGRPRSLRPLPGNGVVLSCDADSGNLVTRDEFQDVEVALEFLIAENSNSGVKLNGMYEIQLYDSADVENPIGNHCGGIYPRGEQEPRYHVIDEGYPPRVNAARPAGEWQTLEISFRSPRFNNEGEKVVNARFEKVVLNGTMIHENVELLHPTGAAWRLVPEVPRGPLLLQGDHGPVAFRNVRVRELTD